MRTRMSLFVTQHADFWGFFSTRPPLLASKHSWPSLCSHSTVYGAMSLETKGLSPPQPLHAKLGSSRPQTNECLVPEESYSPMCCTNIKPITWVISSWVTPLDSPGLPPQYDQPQILQHPILPNTSTSFHRTPWQNQAAPQTMKLPTGNWFF